jgi:hypothetical protein
MLPAVSALAPVPSPPARAPHPPLWYFWIGLGVLGLIARFVLASISIGCDDADIWLQHARTIHEFGLRYAFENYPTNGWHYNHPPFTGYWALFSGNMSDFDPEGFSRYMKAPGLIAEVLTASLLYRVWLPRRPESAPIAFAAYACSLPMILVAGYHCNTEPLYAGLSLFAFYLMVERKQPFYAGLALAGALNIKLMPLFLIPPLFALCRSRRDAILLSAGLALTIVPFAPFLITSGKEMYRNMVAYNSIQMDWGLMAFLNHAISTPTIAPYAMKLRDTAITMGRFWILGSVTLISAYAFWRRSAAGYELGALAWALFLVLTPGFGVQYAVSVVPLFFAVDIKRASLYSLTVGIMLFVIYTFRMVWVLPLHSGVQYFPCPVVAVECGVLAWGVLVAFVAHTLPKLKTTTAAMSPLIPARGTPGLAT